MAAAKNLSPNKKNETEQDRPAVSPSFPYGSGGGKVYSIYTSAAREAKFAKSGDPELPFKVMGTFWALLIGAAMIFATVLMMMQSHQFHSPRMSPPNLLIDGSKF